MTSAREWRCVGVSCSCEATCLTSGCMLSPVHQTHNPKGSCSTSSPCELRFTKVSRPSSTCITRAFRSAVTFVRENCGVVRGGKEEDEYNAALKMRL